MSWNFAKRFLILLSLRALLPSLVRWSCIFSAFFRTGTTVIPESTNGHCTIRKYIKNACFPEGISKPLQGVVLRIAVRIIMKILTAMNLKNIISEYSKQWNSCIFQMTWHSLKSFSSVWKQDKMLYGCSGIWALNRDCELEHSQSAWIVFEERKMTNKTF